MRIKINFILKHEKLPIDYRSCFMSFIKNALSCAKEGKYFSEFYKDTLAKQFTWTTIFHKPVFSKNDVVVQDKQIDMLFSTKQDDMKSLILINAFLNQKGKTFNLPFENAMTLVKIEILSTQKIVGKSAVFKTAPGSSLCVRSHNKTKNLDIYLTPDSENFEKTFHQILQNQLTNVGFAEVKASQIHFCFLHWKKNVVKHYHTNIDTFSAIFAMEADAEILQYFMDCGVGSRRAEGFGFVNLQAAEKE